MVLSQKWVKLGCVADPDLFNCVINYLMTNICQRITGVRLGNCHLTDLEYADDTTLFSDTVVDLIVNLSVFQEETSKHGPQVSWKKTKLLHISYSAHPPQIAIESTTINFVDSFNCFRSLIPSIGDLSREVNQCCSLTAAVIQSLWKPLCRQNSISCQMKLHAYNASVLSVLLYSSETSPLSQYITKT